MVGSKMKIKFSAVIAFVVLLTAPALAGGAGTSTWYVDDDGSADFTKIQDAVDEASQGDTVFVYNGTYNENIEITKDNLTLIGEDRDGVIVIQHDNKEYFIIISADNIAFSGFSIQNGRYTGFNPPAIEILGSNNTFFHNKYLNNSLRGVIYLNSYNILSDNIISHNDIHYDGLIQAYSNNKIFNNTIEYNHDGYADIIYITGNNNILNKNIIRNNTGNLDAGIHLHVAETNIISDNILNGNKEGKGIEISSGYIGGSESSSNNITNNLVSNFSTGISLYNRCTSSQIINNTLISNKYGIVFWGYSRGYHEYNIITNNTVHYSSYTAIYLIYDSIYNKITNNIIYSTDGTGIFIGEDADNNQITNNTVLNNTNYDILAEHDSSDSTENNIITNNTARRIHGDLDKNSIINNIYSRPVITSIFTKNQPTIDGAIEEDEWKNKIEIKLNGFETDDHYNEAKSEKSTKTADLYVMNDDENIYIAVMIEDTSKGDEDSLYFGFDQDDDFVHTDGDEDRAYLDGEEYADGHWDTDVATWYPDDALSHGKMQREWSPTDRIYVYEFMKPLNSGDLQDIKLQAGDMAGFRIEVLDSYPGILYRYPMDTVDHDVVHNEDENIIFTYPVGDESGAWKKWADLITVKENQRPVPNFSYLPASPVVD
jgi:nitrous oxidase accessory protein